MPTDRKIQRTGFATDANPFEFKAISHDGVGQNYPSHYPHLEGTQERNPLGDPLSICQVARMIGCSAWTVRQRHLPQGLPYFRSGRAGKLIFYRNQVVAWILKQQKGGR
jgi:hypothetical protein